MPALSPTAVLNTATGKVSILRGGSTVWGTLDGIVWGDTIVWGTSVITGMDALGSSIIWGDSVFGMADGIVWGDSMLSLAPPQALSANDGDE